MNPKKGTLKGGSALRLCGQINECPHYDHLYSQTDPSQKLVPSPEALTLTSEKYQSEFLAIFQAYGIRDSEDRVW